MSRRVHRGDPLQIDANVYNYAAEQYEKARRGGAIRDSLTPKFRDTRIIIKNVGPDLERFSPCGYGVSLLSPTDPDFFTNPTLLNALPTLSQSYQWGITQEAIPSGEFGEVLVSGVTPVQISAPTGANQQFAVPNGSYVGLDSAACGICRILWRIPGDGYQWAYVNLG